MAGPLVSTGRGLTFGDFRADDLHDVGLGEAAPFGLPGAKTGHGPRDVRAAGASGRRGTGGTAPALSIAARAERRAEVAIVSRAFSA